MKTCSIYTLEHPITGEIRYVGRTTTSVAKRLNRHVYDARKCKGRGCRSTNWIKGLLKVNLLPIITTIDICVIDDRKDVETYWIQQFKAWNFNLLNHKIQDDSTARSASYLELYGEIRALEIKDKISKNHASKKANFISKLKGIPKSAEQRLKISISVKNKINSKNKLNTNAS